MQPLGFGQVLDYTFRNFGRRFKIFFPLTLLFWGLFLFVLELVNVQTIFMDEEADLSLGFLLFILVGFFLIMIGYIITKPILDGAIAKVTLRQFEEKQIQSIGESIEGVKGKVGRLIVTHLILLFFLAAGTAILVGFGFLFMILLIAIFDSSIGIGLSVEGSVIAGIASFFVFALLFILLMSPGIYLFIRFSLIIPIVVNEDIAYFKAFGRSWELTRSSFWRIFGLQFILKILIGIFNGALSMIMVFTSLVLIAVEITSMSGQWIIGIIVAAFTSVLSCIPYSLEPILFTIIYMDRRATREGEDIKAKLEEWKSGHGGRGLEGEVPGV